MAAQIWNYHVLKVNVSLRKNGEAELRETINKHGEAGWEVVSINWFQGDDKAIVILKRPQQ